MTTPVFFGSIPYTNEETERISKALSTRLTSQMISQRAGAGAGGSVMYLEGWKAVEIANEVFGFSGWSSQIISQQIDFLDNINDRWSVGIHCTVRVTLQNGSFHEDDGYGLCENSRSKGLALEKARKEASTDALKRCLRLFGHALGNCLSDKEYIRELTHPSKKLHLTDPSSHSSRPTSAPTYSSSSSSMARSNPPTSRPPPSFSSSSSSTSSSSSVSVAPSPHLQPQPHPPRHPYQQQQKQQHQSQSLPSRPSPNGYITSAPASTPQGTKLGITTTTPTHPTLPSSTTATTSSIQIPPLTHPSSHQTPTRLGSSFSSSSTSSSTLISSVAHPTSNPSTTILEEFHSMDWT